ncbi:YbbR-like domain-containing protein [Zunongwangia sp.]|uniref:YbbR-like domain-containing protein n=1 Tax=Zunongwangia sp. TaxID=1965325 RepID=UPI003AA7D3E3
MKFKKADAKTFGFFLIFSSIIWVLVQFSKEYTETIQLSLNYINKPIDKSLFNEPKTLKVGLKAKGFRILWKYRLFKPDLTIDLEQAKENENSKLVYSLDDNRNSIENQLGVDFDNTTFSKKVLVIDFQKRKEKKVLVTPVTKLNYDIGFSAINPVNLSPDSIMISGPEKVIDTLTQIKTNTISGSKLNSDISGSISIDTSNLGMVNFYKNKVTYHQSVEKFTEGKVQVPVEVENVPKGTNLSIFPKEVMLYYQVNLKSYDDVETSQFSVSCDYNEIQKGVGYMLASVSAKPKFVRNIRISERKIQFIIKR